MIYLPASNFHRFARCRWEFVPTIQLSLPLALNRSSCSDKSPMHCGRIAASLVRQFQNRNRCSIGIERNTQRSQIDLHGAVGRKPCLRDITAELRGVSLVTIAGWLGKQPKRYGVRRQRHHLPAAGAAGHFESWHHLKECSVFALKSICRHVTCPLRHFPHLRPSVCFVYALMSILRSIRRY